MSLFIRLSAGLVLMAPATASAAWLEAKSSHFIIYADLKPDQIKSYAERLERFDQAVRRVRGMADPELTRADCISPLPLGKPAHRPVAFASSTPTDVCAPPLA